MRRVLIGVVLAILLCAAAMAGARRPFLCDRVADS